MLQQYRACRHASYAWSCIKKAATHTTLLTTLAPVEGLSITVCNMASLTARFLRYLPVPVSSLKT